MGGVRCNPIWGQFIRIKLLNVTFISQTAVESLIILFLLVSVPEFSCNQDESDPNKTLLLQSFYQHYIVPATLVSQIIWQFVSASITDRTENYAHIILIVTLLIQSALDVVMYFFAFSPWVILVLYVIRFSLVQQVGNSAGKIFKMRVELALGLSPDKQLECYNHVAIISDFGGRTWVVVGSYGLILLLAKYAALPFDWTRRIFFISLGVTDIMAFLMVITMKKSYYMPPEGEAKSLVQREDEQLEQSTTALYLNDPAFAHRHAVYRYLVYLGRCCISFWRNKLLLCINLQVWIIVMLFAFVNLVLRFSVSNTGLSGPMTPDGYCGGYFLILIETSLYTELSRMGGALFFTFLFKRVTAIYFYSRWSAFFAILLVGCTVLLFFSAAVGPTVLSVNLAFINIIVYLSQVLASNLSGVVVDPAMVGFLFGLQGSVMQIEGLVPLGFDAGFAALLGADKDYGNLGVFLLLVGCSAVFSIWFARKYRKLLVAINQPHASQTEGLTTKAPNCWERWIYGRTKDNNFE